ncbi:hypothetical protein GGS23DRAFT_79742 [Durotheca rogersii]|uniref:uncharacterized protein n=1 Tax=Durotheca rogersii TaxID=419775 RepID=UPI00221F8795|nr:uncharacterized protein GGS23DRAFT_79742 [Durotheca rogersii]KAI5862516.1 hypothetical protein GGS23DRAFT_79742 [Durotheca rogersii]
MYTGGRRVNIPTCPPFFPRAFVCIFFSLLLLFLPGKSQPATDNEVALHPLSIAYHSDHIKTSSRIMPSAVAEL